MNLLYISANEVITDYSNDIVIIMILTAFSDEASCSIWNIKLKTTYVRDEGEFIRNDSHSFLIIVCVTSMLELG
jgi:hypothetical protein